jgi:hypothetical protein
VGRNVNKGEQVERIRVICIENLLHCTQMRPMWSTSLI